MTEEEKDILNLSSSSTTTTDPSSKSVTKDPQEVVVTKEPVYTRESKTSWRENADGTPNKSLMNYHDARLRNIYDQYHYDPNKGDIDRDKTLFDVFGVNPELMRERREKEMERNRLKQKQAAFFNSGAIISDMISAIAGGNVWKRDKDTTAKDAHDANEALRKEQLAADAAAAAAVSKRREALYNAVNALEKDMERFNGTQRVQTGGDMTRKTSGGSTTTMISGGSKTTTKEQEQQAKGSGGGGKKMNVDVNSGSATSKNGYDVDGNEYAALTKRLHSHYSSILDKNDEKADKLRKELLRVGILEETNSGYKWHDDKILGNGEFFLLDDELRRRIVKASNGSFYFVGDKPTITKGRVQRQKEEGNNNSTSSSQVNKNAKRDGSR